MTGAPLYIHIGPPKTGTTFLQTMLMENRRRLARAGIHYPSIGEPDHFLAALDAAGRTTFLGADMPRRKGAWRALATDLLSHEEPGVFSHEILAGTGPATAARVKGDLAGRELHIVATVRDPARQLVADWQEHIKIRRTQTFERYVAAAKLMREIDAADRAKPRPFLGQHVLRALRVWSRDLPPEHVHVVTVPPAGSDPMLLWLRFADAVGIPDASEYDAPAGDGVNRRLGAASTELLRRVNIVLGQSMSGAAYNTIVKGVFAQQILARVSSTPPAAVPEDLRGRVRELADHWVDGIRAAGYRVHGELDDLLPVFAAGPAPSGPGADEVVDEAARAIAELLKIVHDQSRVGEPIAEPADLRAARARRITLDRLERGLRIAAARSAARLRSVLRRDAPPGDR